MIDTGMSVYETIREMMWDRGFRKIEETHRSRSTTTPSMIGKNEKDCECFFFYIEEPKLGIHTLRDIICRIDKKDTDKNCLIIVCDLGQTSFTEKKIRQEKLSSFVSVFKSNRVLHNITKHTLVPKHSMCTQQEVDALLKRIRVKSIHQLPYISFNDPVVRYYNFKANDVLKIERVNGHQELQIYYRLVVHLD